MVTYKDFKDWITTSPYHDWKANAKVTYMETSLPAYLGMGIGIDPGRNFAVATLGGNELRVTYGTFNKADDIQYGVWAAAFMRNTYHWAVDWPVTIEGAAYKRLYGQTGLAYIRFGFYLPMVRITRAAIVPPSSIRKVAFGSGRIKAKEIWPELNENAAAAVGCALHAAGITIDMTGYEGNK